jgi:transcriptional regulator with XRE-family HTH domain
MVKAFRQVIGRQLAAARVLAGLKQEEVAERAGISLATIWRMEASEGPAAGYRNNVAAVVAVLEDAGIEFIPPNGGGPGVRLKAG